MNATRMDAYNDFLCHHMNLTLMVETGAIPQEENSQRTDGNKGVMVWKEWKLGWVYFMVYFFRANTG